MRNAFLKLLAVIFLFLLQALAKSDISFLCTKQLCVAAPQLDG